MATEEQESLEGSDYCSVSSPQTDRTASKEANEEIAELNAIVTINKSLTEEIITLHKQISEFTAEKRNMIESQKKETDYLNKKHEKTLERLSAKSREIQAQLDEINRIKLAIESLRKTEKGLRDKTEKARKDGKYRTEYIKQKREMSASKEEIRRLEEQIVRLENTVAEKDKEISIATKRNVDLSLEIESLAKKDDMEAMENKIIGTMGAMYAKLDGKMEAMERNMIENTWNKQKLFAQQKQSQKTETETGQQSEQNKCLLPPIAGLTPQSALSKRRPDWKP